MVKKLTSEEFCSVAHRQAYQAEQEKMAVARLIEDQQRRRPARQSLSRSSALEAPASTNFLVEHVKPRSIGAQPRVPQSELTFHPATALPPSSAEIGPAKNGISSVQLAGEILAIAGEASVASAMAFLLVEEPIFDQSIGPIPSQPYCVDAEVADTETELGLDFQAVPPAPVEIALSALVSTNETLRPGSGLQPSRDVSFSLDLTHSAGRQLPFDFAMRLTPHEPADLSFPSANEPDLAALNPDAVLPGIAPDPLERPLLPAGILEPETQAITKDPPRLQDDSKPFRMGGVGAWLPAAMNWEVSGRRLVAAAVVEDPVEVEPSSPAAARMPRSAGAWVPTGVGILAPTVGHRSSAITRTAGSVGRLFDRPQSRPPRPVKLDCDSAALFPTRNPPLPKSPGMETILARTQGKCEVCDKQIAHPDDFLRAHPGSWTGANSLFTFHEPFAPKARIASVRRSTLNVTAKTYRSSRLAGISVHPDPGARQAMSYDWQPPAKPLIRPKLQLKPLAARTSQSTLAGLSPFAGISHQFAWEGLKNRWEEAPNDIRWIAMAVPIVIGLLWFSGSPAAQNGARGRLKAMVPDVQGWVKTSFSDDSLDGLKQNIQKRAAVELADDFRQGLGEWAGQGDWSRGWSYDPAGFIRPRQLALYLPSIFLEDYRFEFLGAIERKALSWVFRAADVNNYYAARLEVTRSGPLPTVELVRWAVINGKPGLKKSIPLPMQVRMDTIYRVRVDVRGNDFVTTVQGQVVDVFTDIRLSRGGIGFFSNSGEDARLRWVEVSHQYDMLGRLCAYLVPYNVSNSTVRSAP